MAEGGYPSVSVVDSHVSRPAVPPRLKPRPQRAGAAQTLLFLLVSLALCGMAIEACFIYRLYHTESDTSLSSKQIGDEPVTNGAVKQTTDMHPSKPVAHLTDGTDVVYGEGHNQQILIWSKIADPLLYEMGYKDGKLIIQKEGYYYIYTKVNFLYDKRFYHVVLLKTPLYNGKDIPLLQARKSSEGFEKLRSNSFLGGVFHLHKNDAIYVKVNNISQIIRHKSYENTFGAYMI